MGHVASQRTRDSWLIPIAIVGFIGWPIAHLAGLLWSRWLRPFSAAGRFGYALLLASLTVIPYLLAYFFATHEPLLLDRVWQVGVYLVSFGIWLVLHVMVFDTPSRSVPRAILAASAGALLAGPALTSGGQVLVFLPLWACAAWNVTGWMMGGAVPPPEIAAAGLACALPAFLGLLIVQWPKRPEIAQS
jgi:hypothetical protein